MENEINAMNNIIPELSPKWDVRELPSVISPGEFKKRLEQSKTKDIIVLTNHILMQKNEFLSGIANILVSDIAKKIKETQRLYAVVSKFLVREYPLISASDGIIFLDEDEGNKFVENFNKSNKIQIRLKPVEKNEIHDYFVSLSRVGIEYVRIEPTLCKLRYKQNQLFENDFAAVSDSSVNFKILKFLQCKENNGQLPLLRVLENDMLFSIAKSSFACKGITVGGKFEAVLVTDKRDSSKWITLFTDTQEIQDTYETIPTIRSLLLPSETTVLSFSELYEYFRLDKVSGVVVNISGYGLRIDKNICKEIIKNQEKLNNKDSK